MRFSRYDRSAPPGDHLVEYLAEFLLVGLPWLVDAVVLEVVVQRQHRLVAHGRDLHFCHDQPQVFYRACLARAVVADEAGRLVVPFGEVGKEAADMVITDDNFATIVGAVEQVGSTTPKSLRFVQYLFSCNLAEIVVVFTALMIGWPLPLGAL